MKTFQDYQQIGGRREHTIECVSHLLDLDKQTEKTFRMINIEVYSVHDNLLNVSIVQRSPNFVLFKYKRIMSFIFLLSSLFVQSPCYALRETVCDHTVYVLGQDLPFENQRDWILKEPIVC